MAGLAARGARGGVLLTILALSVIVWITGLAEFGGILGSPPVMQKRCLPTGFFTACQLWVFVCGVCPVLSRFL